jgi:hypothetical protein
MYWSCFLDFPNPPHRPFFTPPPGSSQGRGFRQVRALRARAKRLAHGVGEWGRRNFGFVEHLLVLARTLPELPGGEPEGPVGRTSAWVRRPSSECIHLSASSCRAHAVQLVPGLHGRTPVIHRRLEHRPSSRVVGAH